MSEAAWIVHRIPGRLRLRLPQRRTDNGFFADLKSAVQALPAIAGVHANAVTGSLLVEFADAEQGIEQLDDLMVERAIELRWGDPPMNAARPAIRKGLERLDQYVGLASQQATDLRSIGVLLFFALAVLQLTRGQVLAPATSLLWYALDLLRDPSPRRPSGD